MLSDAEIDSRPIVRKVVDEELIERGGGRWRHTFDDGVVAECIRQPGARWEIRIVEPFKAHNRQQFASHNAAWRFLIREPIA
jgi:hypothetical protein